MTDPLADEPFAYQALKSGSVQLFYRGRLVETLSGRNAQKFLVRAKGASAQQLQLLLARATRNFKHGNERLASLRPAAGE